VLETALAAHFLQLPEQLVLAVEAAVGIVAPLTDQLCKKSDGEINVN
jgi:hypothetical protein